MLLFSFFMSCCIIVLGLKIRPKITEDKIWDSNKIIPILVLLNIVRPIVINMYAGFALFVNNTR